MSERTSVGLIGCGNISAVYLRNAARFGVYQIAAVADLIHKRAEERAAEFGVPKACTVAELLADPAIDYVLNLTIPGAHAEVSEAALRAGKHVYSEKPLALAPADAARLLSLAQERGLDLGCAPDTFLGSGLQTCRELVDAGEIGEIVGAAAFMLCRGHEGWHPDPEFYYKRGGGPLLDMGPYYLTALIHLMGPIRRVSGLARATSPTRTIRSEPRRGQVITVEVPTHSAALLEFASGAIGTITTSFDVAASQLPPMELYGSQATLAVPDPNGFGGPVRVRRVEDAEWKGIELCRPFTVNSRGLGLAEMILARRAGRQPRCSGLLAAHVLEVMSAIEGSAGRPVAISGTNQALQPLLWDNAGVNCA